VKFLLRSEVLVFLQQNMPRILTRGNFDSTDKNISETTLTLKELQKMQKKILVLAIAAAISAPAFADTTVYGLVDAAVANVGGAGLQTATTAASGGLASSRLGVKATEKLDNGMTAVVVLEYGLDTETSNTIGAQSANSTTPTTSLAARQQMLALASDFGTVATGFLQTAGYDFGSKYNPVSGSLVSPLGNIVKGGSFFIGDQGAASRAQRAVAYISPNMGGLVLAANYAASLQGLGNVAASSSNTTAAGATQWSNDTSATLLSADYTAGMYSVGAVYLVTNQSAGSLNGAATAGTTAGTGAYGNVTEWSVGASANFGVAKVFLTYQDKALLSASNTTVATATAANHNTAASASVTVPVGPGTVAASYAVSSMATVANTDASGYAIAYLQGLSKTTTAYVAYNAMQQGAGAAGTTASTVSVMNSGVNTNLSAGGSSSIVAVGLSKKF
jgi:predicted porin